MIMMKVTVRMRINHLGQNLMGKEVGIRKERKLIGL